MTEAPQLPSTSTNRPLAPATAVIAFLAPPPLIEGEDAAGYDELLARISGTLKPADILEEIWVRDVVDLVWDAFRLRRLKAHLGELVEPHIAAHRGRIVKRTGDGLLVDFASAVEAVRCAVAIQAGMADRNRGEPDDRIEFRIGINLGDVIIEDGDIYGDGVNIAARL